MHQSQLERAPWGWTEGIPWHTSTLDVPLVTVDVPLVTVVTLDAVTVDFSLDATPTDPGRSHRPQPPAAVTGASSRPARTHAHETKPQ